MAAVAALGSLRRMNHFATKHLLLGFVIFCPLIFAGCISSKNWAGIGAAVVESAVKPMLGLPMELARGANKFRNALGHWPEGYDELADFLKQSDNRTFTRLQTVQFHSIYFSKLPDGRLRIDADYSAGSGARIRIEDMRIRAIDPDDMDLCLTRPATSGEKI